MAKKSSAEANQTSWRRRSNELEKVLYAITHGADHDKAVTATVALQSDMSQQNKNTFLAAANSAAIKIFSSFTLDEMASLSTKLLLRTIAAIKHMFTAPFGCNPFSPLSAVRQRRDELSFKFEWGFYNTADNKTVRFLRVTDTADVLRRTVSWLRTSDQLLHIPCYVPGELRLLVTIDKGGPSTKMVIQVLNCRNRHSTKTARLLAFFRGDVDSYDNMKKVLQPTKQQKLPALSYCPLHVQSKPKQSLAENAKAKARIRFV